MLEVHSLIHELKKTLVKKVRSTKPVPFDPIAPVARLISEKTWLLCFDEFQVCYYKMAISHLESIFMPHENVQ